MQEHLVEFHLFIPVYLGDDTLLVKHGKCLVNLFEFCFNFFLQVIVALIGYAVESTEYGASVMLIRHVVLMLDDQYGSDNQKGEER